MLLIANMSKIFIPTRSCQLSELKTAYDELYQFITNDSSKDFINTGPSQLDETMSSL